MQVPCYVPSAAAPSYYPVPPPHTVVLPSPTVVVVEKERSYCPAPRPRVEVVTPAPQKEPLTKSEKRWRTLVSIIAGIAALTLLATSIGLVVGAGFVAPPLGAAIMLAGSGIAALGFIGAAAISIYVWDQDKTVVQHQHSHHHHRRERKCHDSHVTTRFDLALNLGGGKRGHRRRY